jgi:hypothetical protein
MRVSENGEGELAAMTAVQMMFLLATFLCSLVAGLLFTFAYVVMPGIAKLDDNSFLRAFQAIDRVIQNNQRISLRVVGFSARSDRGGSDERLGTGWNRSPARDRCRPCLRFRCAIAQGHDQRSLEQQASETGIGTMSEEEQQRTRMEFEPRWYQWNAIRTACSIFASMVLLLLLLRL